MANIGDLIAAEEREPLTAWVMQGIKRVVQRSEYTLPESHQQIIYDMGNINNSVKFFLEESNKIEMGVEGAEMSESQVYNLYWAFCQSAGSLKAATVTKFRSMLRELETEMKFKMVMRGGKGSTECVLVGMQLKK